MIATFDRRRYPGSLRSESISGKIVIVSADWGIPDDYKDRTMLFRF